MLDPVRNFAKVFASTGYSSAATSIVLATGQGAKLPLPATDGAFNLTWWNATDYADPSDDPSAQIIRVTARSGDALTIIQGQEGTLAQDMNLTNKQYSLILGLTSKTITDIGTAIAAGVPYSGATNDLDLGNHFLKAGDGSVSAPSIRVSNNAGLYKSNTTELGITNGVSSVRWDGVNFYPGTADVRSLGSTTNKWKDLWISSVAHIQEEVLSNTFDYTGQSGAGVIDISISPDGSGIFTRASIVKTFHYTQIAFKAFNGVRTFDPTGKTTTITDSSISIGTKYSQEIWTNNSYNGAASGNADGYIIIREIVGTGFSYAVVMGNADAPIDSSLTWISGSPTLTPTLYTVNEAITLNKNHDGAGKYNDAFGVGVGIDNFGIFDNENHRYGLKQTADSYGNSNFASYYEKSFDYTNQALTNNPSAQAVANVSGGYTKGGSPISIRYYQYAYKYFNGVKTIDPTIKFVDINDISITPLGRKYNVNVYPAVVDGRTLDGFIIHRVTPGGTNSWRDVSNAGGDPSFVDNNTGWTAGLPTLTPTLYQANVVTVNDNNDGSLKFWDSLGFNGTGIDAKGIYDIATTQYLIQPFTDGTAGAKGAGWQITSSVDPYSGYTTTSFGVDGGAAGLALISNGWWYLNGLGYDQSSGTAVIVSAPVLRAAPNPYGGGYDFIAAADDGAGNGFHVLMGIYEYGWDNSSMLQVGGQITGFSVNVSGYLGGIYLVPMYDSGTGLAHDQIYSYGNTLDFITTGPATFSNDVQLADQTGAYGLVLWDATLGQNVRYQSVGGSLVGTPF